MNRNVKFILLLIFVPVLLAIPLAYVSSFISGEPLFDSWGTNASYLFGFVVGAWIFGAR